VWGVTMSRSSKNLAVFVISILGTMALLLVLCSCASTPEVQYQTVKVLVPVVVAPPPLLVPPAPVRESLIENESDWLNYLRAMTRDLLNAWAHIELLHSRIEDYNAAAAEVTGPTEPVD